MAQLKTKIALRSDTTEQWQSVADTVTLVKGEVGIEFLTDGAPKMKIGDGISTWGQLPYVGGSEANVLEVIPQEGETHTQAIERVAAGKSLSSGDIAYVKVAIYVDAEDETKNKYSYTGYVYNGTAWAAMDGNYSADNVYFDEDMMVTKEIGYITLTNGSGKIPSAGKNLTQVFEAMFVKEAQPSITQPSVNLTATENNNATGKEYEVGTKVTPSYSVSLNVGSYSYGPATGVTEQPTDETDTGWKITATGVSGFKTIKSGSFDEIIVKDDTSFKITAVVNHTGGTTPLTNKGNVSTKTPIAAGTKSKDSGLITGYRKFFYGPITKAVTDLTSADIRGLTDGGKYSSKGITIKADGATNIKSFVIAVPSNTTAGIKKLLSTAGMTVEMPTSSYVLSPTQIDVADVRGGVVTKDGNTYTSDNNPMKYNLYVWTPDAVGSDTVHEITLA